MGLGEPTIRAAEVARPTAKCCEMTTQKRRAIPVKIRAEVLREWRHRCAVCGADGPQVHHIDEDHSNNDPANLLPLCPNHHLRDQHDPTSKIAPRKLALFRRYKDPAILSPQFEPLFRRLLFLDDVGRPPSKSAGALAAVYELEERANELSAFVRALGMGEFYGEQIATLAQRDRYNVYPTK